ncbi:MAG: UDP-N-acetylmuramoyl-L-alanine--D-glutamate ligase [Acidimicrobiales bacterium]|nr:UDP-N-acetylmuramoyl-L-alanine--D-glutamate ligase [Acidimicrobiales bacterium]
MERKLVSPVLMVGGGVTGTAVAELYCESGLDLDVIDDRPTLEMEEKFRRLGFDVFLSPEGDDQDKWRELLSSVERTIVSPGIPASHPVYSMSAMMDIDIMSEIELAGEISEVPILAITGTNGKTTITTLVSRMLNESGINSVACGNIGEPLVRAAKSAKSQGTQFLIAEVSSFQLALTKTFHPHIGLWCNLGEDHLDWHPDFDHYRNSKAKIWENLDKSDIAVANADDPMVLKSLSRLNKECITLTYGYKSKDYRVVNNDLMTPTGEVIVSIDELKKNSITDISNALAACAMSLEAGCDINSCKKVLKDFVGLSHRVEHISDFGGIEWIDDSKATTPSAVLAALKGRSNVVLIAGGRNKGLDLSVLRQGGNSIYGVIAIGESQDQIVDAFAGLDMAIERANSMEEAVKKARGISSPGMTVMLSPGTASFDWYSSYAERGDDFKKCVQCVAEVEL